MATLRETLQAEVNRLQAEADKIRVQLDKQSPEVEALLNYDTDSLLVFFKIFKDQLGL